ncbi:MAG: hypothetical protein HGN29_15385 [Asgard group archaeon]|nr:hypothetical protein [Asgard group archaeon]
MTFLWGDTEDARDAKKNSFERRLAVILSEQGKIHINELMKIMWGGHYLLTNFQGILEMVKHLVKEGKIIFNDNYISLALMTVFEDGGFREKSVWDIIQKEEDVEEKKEIMRRYKEINSLT